MGDGGRIRYYEASRYEFSSYDKRNKEEQEMDHYEKEQLRAALKEASYRQRKGEITLRGVVTAAILAAVIVAIMAVK